MIAQNDENVIHVSFVDRRRVEAPPAPEEQAFENEGNVFSDPLSELFSRADVARIIGCTIGRLRYWHKKGFLSPSATRGKRSLYTFSDLIQVRVAHGLIEEGVALAEVERSIRTLQERLPTVARPLSELRIVSEGGTIIVRGTERVFEPSTGQCLLDFEVGDLRADVVQILGKHKGAKRKLAFDFYLDGCRLDENEETYLMAEEAYRKALKIDPSLSCAWTNLGNLAFRQNRVVDASECYERALRLDPDQPEAYFNLGFIACEQDRLLDAVNYFEAAIFRDCGFADAHFHLALTLDEIGDEDTSLTHYARYLELEPAGDWSREARQRLEDANR